MEPENLTGWKKIKYYHVLYTLLYKNSFRPDYDTSELVVDNNLQCKPTELSDNESVNGDNTDIYDNNHHHGLTGCRNALFVIYNISTSHLGLVILLIVYSVIGASLFEIVEGEVLNTDVLTERREFTIDTILGIFSMNFSNINNNQSLRLASETITSHNNSSNTKNETFLKYFNESVNFDNIINSTTVVTVRNLVDQELRSYEKFLRSDPISKIVHRLDEKWDFQAGLFYCFTVYTTIGYGKLYPLTAAGKWMTVIYGIFGIPLCLITLADIGLCFSEFLKFIYIQKNKCGNRLTNCCVCCKRKRKADKTVILDPSDNNTISYTNSSVDPHGRMYHMEVPGISVTHARLERKENIDIVDKTEEVNTKVRQSKKSVRKKIKADVVKEVNQSDPYSLETPISGLLTPCNSINLGEKQAHDQSWKNNKCNSISENEQLWNINKCYSLVEGVQTCIGENDIVSKKHCVASNLKQENDKIGNVQTSKVIIKTCDEELHISKTFNESNPGSCEKTIVTTNREICESVKCTEELEDHQTYNVSNNYKNSEYIATCDNANLSDKFPNHHPLNINNDTGEIKGIMGIKENKERHDSETCQLQFHSSMGDKLLIDDENTDVHGSINTKNEAQSDPTPDIIQSCKINKQCCNVVDDKQSYGQENTSIVCYNKSVLINSTQSCNNQEENSNQLFDTCYKTMDTVSYESEIRNKETLLKPCDDINSINNLDEDVKQSVIANTKIEDEDKDNNNDINNDCLDDNDEDNLFIYINSEDNNMEKDVKLPTSINTCDHVKPCITEMPDITSILEKPNKSEEPNHEDGLGVSNSKPINGICRVHLNNREEPYHEDDPVISNSNVPNESCVVNLNINNNNNNSDVGDDDDDVDVEDINSNIYNNADNSNPNVNDNCSNYDDIEISNCSNAANNVNTTRIEKTSEYVPPSGNSKCNIVNDEVVQEKIIVIDDLNEVTSDNPTKPLNTNTECSNGMSNIKVNQTKRNEFAHSRENHYHMNKDDSINTSTNSLDDLKNNLINSCGSVENISMGCLGTNDNSEIKNCITSKDKGILNSNITEEVQGCTGESTYKSVDNSDSITKLKSIYEVTQVCKNVKQNMNSRTDNENTSENTHRSITQGRTKSNNIACDAKKSKSKLNNIAKTYSLAVDSPLCRNRDYSSRVLDSPASRYKPNKQNSFADISKSRKGSGLVGDRAMNLINHVVAEEEQPKPQPKLQPKISEDDEEEEEEFEDDVIHSRVPMRLPVLITLLYMLGGVWIYSFFEGWGFTDAFYFVFISFSSIGFGDLVPRKLSFFIYWLYTMFGLTLVAMTITFLTSITNTTLAKAKHKVDILAEKGLGFRSPFSNSNENYWSKTARDKRFKMRLSQYI